MMVDELAQPPTQPHTHPPTQRYVFCNVSLINYPARPHCKCSPRGNVATTPPSRRHCTAIAARMNRHRGDTATSRCLITRHRNGGGHHCSRCGVVGGFVWLIAVFHWSMADANSSLVHRRSKRHLLKTTEGNKRIKRPSRFAILWVSQQCNEFREFGLI